MRLVKQVVEHKVTVGGYQHSGWLPLGASRPLPTPVREVLMNIEIQFDGSGYLLCYASTDGELWNDTWHHTLEEAQDAAADMFGVEHDQWQDV